MQLFIDHIKTAPKTVKTSWKFYCFSPMPLFSFSHQEVPQEARSAGVVGGSHHSDRVPHCGQVWPQHHHAAHPLLRHAVLVFRNCPHRYLDCVAVLYPVRSRQGQRGWGMGLGWKFRQKCVAKTEIKNAFFYRKLQLNFHLTFKYIWGI